MTVIRTSDRMTFKACRRKWDLGSKIRQNYEPLQQPTPLEFGTAIHAGLEAYYNPELWEMDPAVKQTAALLDFKLVCIDQKEHYLKIQNQVSLDYDVEEEFKERLELGEGMLRNYFTWAPEQDKNLTPVKVEIEFEVPIPDTEHVYQGRVDLLAQDENGYYWIIDHKTAAQLGPTDHLDLDEQCGSYCWALSTQLQLPIAGVIYNELVKSVPHPPALLQSGRLSKNKQQRTTYDLYVKAIEEHNQPISDYMEFLDYLKEKPNQYFRRTQIGRSVREQKNLAAQVREEALDMTSNPRIYPNSGRFNCMGCQFKYPCLAINDGSDVDFILNQLYRKRDE